MLIYSQSVIRGIHWIHRIY